jgi:hypothetical protein
MPARVYGRRRGGRLRDARAAYARAVEFARALIAVVALLVGVPLVILGLALVGPFGWIVAAVVFPLATLGTILWLGRARPGDGEPPGPD